MSDGILVTGSTGQLGTHFVAGLNRKGVIPRVLLRSPCPSEAWGDLRVDPVEGEITNGSDRSIDQVAAALDGVKTVYHLAARVHLAGDDSAEQWRTNLHGTANLYRATAHSSVERFIHVSTIGTVGASEDGEPLDEESSWNLGGMGNPYFDSKRAAEEYILSPPGFTDDGALPPRPDGPAAVVVNPSIIIGPRATVRKRARSLARGEEPPVRSWSGPPSWFPLLRFQLFDFPLTYNVVDTDDVSAGMLCAADKGKPGERYLLTGENSTYRSAVELLSRWYPVAVPRLRVSRKLFAFAVHAASPAAPIIGRSPVWMRSRAALSRLTWHYTAEKAKRELDWKPVPLEETARKIFGEPRVE